MSLFNLRGQIERITYSNTENDYTVLKAKVYGYSELVTIVGNIASPTPGEVLNMSGEWICHPRFGNQFKVIFYKSSVPASITGIERYLGSGLIKGIGPAMSKRIVKIFGEKTLDTIEKSPDKLIEIKGIGEHRVDLIKKAWIDQKEIHSVMIFLQFTHQRFINSMGIKQSLLSKRIHIVLLMTFLELGS